MIDSLRRNSTLLIISQGVNAAATFIFWIICARVFTANTIGLATSFISFGILVATFTSLGLPNTIIRFMPMSNRRGGLFTSSLLLVLFSSIAGGALAWFLIRAHMPRLSYIQSSPFFIFILFLSVLFNTINALLDGTLLAFRKGQYILGKAVFISLPRIILPFFVVSLGLKGILGTYIAVFLFGITYNLIIILGKLLRGEQLSPRFTEIKSHRSYALSNYLGGMFGILPSTLVPLIVLSKLGATSAAYFYMPMQIAMFLNIISASTSSALISESSQTEISAKHREHFTNASHHLYQMLIPAILILSVTAWPILSIYGKQYALHGFIPLLVLASSSIFVAINWLGDTWLNIQKKALAYFLMNTFNAIVVVGSVLMLASRGLIYVSIGWLVGQIISAAVYIIIFARNELSAFLPASNKFR